MEATKAEDEDNKHCGDNSRNEICSDTEMPEGDNEAIELKSLNVAVYEHSTFEQKILQEINKNEKKHWIDAIEEGEIDDNSVSGKEQPDDLDSHRVVNKIEVESTPATNLNTLDRLQSYLKSQFELDKLKKKTSISNLEASKGEKRKTPVSPLMSLKKQLKENTLQKKQKKQWKINLLSSKVTKEKEVEHEINPITFIRKKNLENDGSDPEYLPSDEISISTDDEEKGAESLELQKSSSKRNKKEADDGDIDIYHERIREWQSEYKSFHSLGSNCKIPLSIWDQLYPYQKEGVEWLWSQGQAWVGGILGDEMGLGKTVQVVALLAGLQCSGNLKPSLIVCPATVMHQWVREFHKWIPPIRVAILHESGNFQGKDRWRLVKIIHERGTGIIVTSYSGLVQNKEVILSRPWHYVVLDEGHKIRNPSAKVTIVAKELECRNRLILTGSPLQNNLRELWSLLDFVYPGKLGSLETFTNEFTLPITQGGYANATKAQVLIGFKRALALKDLIMPHLKRRSKAEVGASAHLPSKSEQVLFCALTPLQRNLYNNFVSTLDLSDIAHGSKKVFSALHDLRKICNHPDLFTPPINGDGEFGDVKKAGKMIVVETLLKIWKSQDHRVLLFSQGIKMLNLLEKLIKKKGYNYLRLDGSTSISSRQPLIDKFNKDISYFVMLLTTKVGGLGVNLTGADRVVIYDPDWNPATDTQARERAWRIGQTKPVTVYRLITAATIEEKIYHRQIYKQFLSNRVLKDPRQRRFFKSNDLMELFSPAIEGGSGTTETGAIFAGTSSEVTLPSKVSDRRKSKVVIEAGEVPKVEFSKNKIEEMKRIAHALSKKIGSLGSIPNDTSDKANKVPSNKSSHGERPLSPIPSTSSSNHPLLNSSVILSSVSAKDKKQESLKKEKWLNFEGESVSHLLKKKKIKRKKRKEDKEERKNQLNQDEYVLRKLFSKSGVEAAMKHDKIMEGGPSDYALVEAEAERKAKDAVENLRKSSVGSPFLQNCNPSFIITNKKKKKGNGGNGESSQNILDNLRSREMIMETGNSERGLLRSIINWICSQGGTATTAQLVNEFSPKVENGKSPLFKSFLESVATFYKGPDKIGYWTIKDEFKELIF